MSVVGFSHPHSLLFAPVEMSFFDNFQKFQPHATSPSKLPYEGPFLHSLALETIRRPHQRCAKNTR